MSLHSSCTSNTLQAIEIVEHHQTDTYRAVYTVKFEEAIYVLHCFQKKSAKGIETPKPDRDMIARRLKEAKRIHEENEAATKQEKP